MPDAKQTVDAESVIRDAIHALLERRGAAHLTVRPDSRITAELEFDSLELAELSQILEDELGRDPYSEGIIPDTVAELVGFYRG